MQAERDMERRRRMDDAGGLIVSVLSKLTKLLNGEYNLPTGAKENLESMARNLRRLAGCYAETQVTQLYQFHQSDYLYSSIHHLWFRQMRDVFYEADDLVDYFVVLCESSEPATNQLGRFRQLIVRIRDSSDPLDHIMSMKMITARVMEMLENWKSYSLGASLWPTRKHEKVSGLVGIDGPMDMLIERLAEGDNKMPKKQMKIVSIVGSQGLGKTTLAYTVYQHLKPHFQCGAFVRVSPHQSGMDRFFRDMLFQLDVANHTNIVEKENDKTQLISQIAEFLQGKRYLIVIDDLWVEEDWCEILSCFPDTDCGSRVITTTRDNDIAKLCCSGCEEWIHKIQHLGYPDSEMLFLKRIFVSEVSCPDAPIGVFPEILKMCGGTPSAIISIASLLTTKVTAIKTWQETMNSIHSVWKLTAGSLDSGTENIPGFEDLRDILSLIYHHLPSTLKDCLLHIAVHAKNQVIHKTTIVRKWIAEGFISEYVNSNRDEVARRYFDELVNRNLIQIMKYGNYFGEETYEINYMMLCVLRLIAHEHGFSTILSDFGISREYVHSLCLSIQCSGSEQSVRIEKRNKMIRSITIVGPAKFYLNNDLLNLRVMDLDGCQNLDNSAMDQICRMIQLKYLSLKHTQVSEIPPEIGKLQYVETLDIRQTQISNIPPEIGKLQVLETLDARHTLVKELPKELVLLPKLAHLYFGQCSSPRGVKLPAGSEQLKSVKVLGTVDSREWSGSAMEEIGGLTGVQKLEVVLHDQPTDKDQNDRLISSIGKCVNLEYLIIYGDYNPSDSLAESSGFPLLEKLKVAGRFVKVPRWMAQISSLKKLDIRVCKLEQEDLKILGGLPGLTTLALAVICIPRKKKVSITNRLQCTTSTDLSPEEETNHAGFRSLEVFIFDCGVPWITFNEGAMPRLKLLHLKLYACPTDKFASGIINLRSLQKIILRYSSHHASSGGITKAVASVREEAASHDNTIELSVNGGHEVFLSNNRVDETIIGTEHEECC